MSQPLSVTDFPPLPIKRVKYERNIVQITKKSQASPTAASLNDLPTELLITIIEYLPCHEFGIFQLPTIKALSSVNRRFHALVTRYLYAEYNSYFGQPYMFLRTLLNNRTAAEMVRAFSFNYGPLVREDRPLYRPTNRDRREVKAGFKALKIPDWKLWARCVNECSSHGEDDIDNILFTAMLICTPNVASLDIEHSAIPVQYSRVLELLDKYTSRGTLCVPHRFQHLRSIHFDADEETTIDKFAPIFRLTALETFNLTHVLCFTQPKRWNVITRSSPLRKLFLDRCGFTAQNLVLLLDSCLALQEFRYNGSYEGNPDLDTELGNFAYPSLVKALTQHSQSLVSLSLEETRIPHPDAHRASCIGSLDGLTRLQSLCGSIDILMGKSSQLYDTSLLSSLQSYTVQLFTSDDQIRMLKVLHSLVTAPQGALPPALTSIRLIYRPLRQKTRKKFAFLAEALNNIGIRLVIESQDDEEESWARFDEDTEDSGSTASSNGDTDTESDSSSHYALDEDDDDD